MTAAYTPSGNAATRHNTARATNVENEFQSVSDGLATFPNASDMKNGTTSYAVDTGTANALLVAMPTTATAYTDGMLVVVKALVSNTGSTTINVDGIGVKQVRRQTGSQVVAGDIVAGSIYEMRYNGTYFLLTGFGNTLVESVDNISADISTVAGISSDVTSVAANETNINSAVANEANINAVATNIANVIAVDGNEANINTVAADATDIGTVSTNIAEVVSVASNMADINANATLIGAVTATTLSFTPPTGMTSTNVQAAIEELNTKSDKLRLYQHFMMGS